MSCRPGVNLLRSSRPSTYFAAHLPRCKLAKTDEESPKWGSWGMRTILHRSSLASRNATSLKGLGSAPNPPDKGDPSRSRLASGPPTTVLGGAPSFLAGVQQGIPKNQTVRLIADRLIQKPCLGNGIGKGKQAFDALGFMYCRAHASRAV